MTDLLLDKYNISWHEPITDIKARITTLRRDISKNIFFFAKNPLPYAREYSIWQRVVLINRLAFFFGKAFFAGITKKDLDYLFVSCNNPDLYKYYKNPRAIEKDEHIAWFSSYTTNAYDLSCNNTLYRP